MRQKAFALAAAALVVTGVAEAGGVEPKVDLTGRWETERGESVRYVQEGAQLDYLFVGSTEVRSFVGRYVGPTRVEGTEHRVNLADGCETELHLTITAESGDKVLLSKEALASACDLQKGQVFAGSATRTAAPAPSAPPPICTRFTPTLGLRGQTMVTITGQNFVSVRGVNFGDTPSYDYYVTSSTTIRLPVPETAEAGSNLISVTTQSGTAHCPGSFNVHQGKFD